MPLSIKQVRYFIATADSGQVSQAAILLNVSQSAVTTAIKQLEDTLGVNLFRRLASGVVLTAEGSRFLTHARNVMAAVNAAERAPLNEETALSGVVRVGVTYTVLGYFLPRLYARFARTYPKIRVELQELPRNLLEERLNDGTLDMAVMLVSNLRDKTHLAFETLLRSRRRLWLPAEHPLLSVETITLEDVAREPYVMLTVDEASETAGRYWQQAGLEPKVIFTTSSVEAVRSFVADGIGITILSDMVYRPWSLEGQRIELRNVVAEIPTMDVGVAWNRGKPQAPATRTFTEFLSLSFGGGQPL
ncbi:LysR family transcriptional regulator [Gellertiella hungarica]|uniref:DNA-binding transcriptional LysR family regulator n=1 Tax=Gellertiella hungarica TaxID=1572859 RepID=A0A7W6J748_9HYPH|nr:LysR family transcriptional regulator [Gellertiella hungarica]MBB4066031.1 DNA-binding transcriptional LysR family regulator [Gellertiella hungarica]